MTQIRFKFQCGCINSETIRSKTQKGSARRYCPKHPTSPATHKVFTCEGCGEDVLKPMQSGGPSRKYCDACYRESTRKRSLNRYYAEQGMGTHQRSISSGQTYATADEIEFIKSWKRSAIKGYLGFLESEHAAKRDWGDIDPEAVRQACRELLEGAE